MTSTRSKKVKEVFQVNYPVYVTGPDKDGFYTAYFHFGSGQGFVTETFLSRSAEAAIGYAYEAMAKKMVEGKWSLLQTNS